MEERDHFHRIIDLQEGVETLSKGYRDGESITNHRKLSQHRSPEGLAQEMRVHKGESGAPRPICRCCSERESEMRQKGKGMAHHVGSTQVRKIGEASAVNLRPVVVVGEKIRREKQDFAVFRMFLISGSRATVLELNSNPRVRKEGIKGGGGVPQSHSRSGGHWGGEGDRYSKLKDALKKGSEANKIARQKVDIREAAREKN